MTVTTARAQWGKLLLVLAAIAAIMGGLIFVASPAAQATPPTGPTAGQNCRIEDGYDLYFDSSDAEVSGSEFSYTAPADKVIVEVCIKAGDFHEVFTYTPGVSSVTELEAAIVNGSGVNLGISHVGVKLVDDPGTSSSSSTTSTSTSSSTTSTSTSSSTTSTSTSSSTTSTSTSSSTTSSSTTSTTSTPTDVCLNLEGNQAEVPEGYFLIEGECLTDTTEGVVDACKNIEGDQETIPEGYTIDEQGNCVTGSTPTLTEVVLAATGANGTSGGAALGLSLVLGGMGLMLLRKRVAVD